MRTKLWKKTKTVIAGVMATLMLSSTAMAAGVVEISNVEFIPDSQDDTKGKFIVSYKVSEKAANHQTTIMAYDVGALLDGITIIDGLAEEVLRPTVSPNTGENAGKGLYDNQTTSPMIGIDQFAEAAEANVTATAIIEGISLEHLYAIRMGGSGVDTVGVWLENLKSTPPPATVPPTPGLNVDFEVKLAVDPFTALAAGDTAYNEVTISAIGDNASEITLALDKKVSGSYTGTPTAFTSENDTSSADNELTEYKLTVTRTSSADNTLKSTKDFEFKVDFAPPAAPVISSINGQRYTNNNPTLPSAPSGVEYAIDYYESAVGSPYSWGSRLGDAPEKPAVDKTSKWVKVVITATKTANQKQAAPVEAIYELYADEDVTGPTKPAFSEDDVVVGEVGWTGSGFFHTDGTNGFNVYEDHLSTGFARVIITLDSAFSGSWKGVYTDGSYSVELLYSEDKFVYDFIVKNYSALTLDQIWSKIAWTNEEPSKIRYGYIVSEYDAEEIIPADYISAFQLSVLLLDVEVDFNRKLKDEGNQAIMKWLLATDVDGVNAIIPNSYISIFQEAMFVVNAEDYPIMSKK